MTCEGIEDAETGSPGCFGIHNLVNGLRCRIPEPVFVSFIPRGSQRHQRAYPVHPHGPARNPAMTQQQQQQAVKVVPIPFQDFDRYQVGQPFRLRDRGIWVVKSKARLIGDKEPKALLVLEPRERL